MKWSQTLSGFGKKDNPDMWNKYPLYVINANIIIVSSDCHLDMSLLFLQRLMYTTDSVRYSNWYFSKQRSAALTIGRYLKEKASLRTFGITSVNNVRPMCVIYTCTYQCYKYIYILNMEDTLNIPYFIEQYSGVKGTLFLNSFTGWYVGS